MSKRDGKKGASKTEIKKPEAKADKPNQLAILVAFETTTAVAFSDEGKIGRMLNEANLLRSRGKIEDAIALLDEILTLEPQSTQARNLKGMSYKQGGDNPKAMTCFHEVLEMNPEDWCAHNNLGVIFKDENKYDRSVTEYAQAIKFGPRECVAKDNMAVVLTDYGTNLKVQGRVTDAIRRYTEASSYNPTYASAYFNMGVVCAESDNYIEALRYYNFAIRCNPNYVEALCNIGVIYKNAAKLEQAIDFYQRALKANANFTIASNNLAIALTDFGTKIKTDGDVKTGIDYYKKALVYNSRYSPAWYNLGVAHAEQGRYEDAMVCYEMAVNFDPKCSEAYNNLGVIYKDSKGNLDKAMYFYKKALEANPRFSQTLNNLGVIYTMLGKLDEAYLYCRKAIAANQLYAEAYNNLGVLYRDEGKIRKAVESYGQCLALDINSRNAGQNRLLALNSLLPAKGETDEHLSEFIWREHFTWGSRFCSLFKPYTHWQNKLTFDRPIRVGYLSADFFTHSVSYFIEAPLAHTNPERVYNICYSNVVRNDKRTDHLIKLAHQWQSVYGLTPQQVGEMVRRDEVDILVELTGHTAGNRLDVMAMHPAPVQVTWIGYPNTTGMPTIEYRFSDDIVDPMDTKQKYSEELYRLPSAFLCYTPPEAPEVSETPAIANGFVTFGSFNNLAKVNSRLIKIWCTILNKVKDSRMLVKCKPFACEMIKKNMYAKFEKHGISHKRVDLSPLLPSTKEHLSMYSTIDISLDTFPYAGTTTTCEALYMGVPVITLAKQNNHAHSVGATLLSRVKSLKPFITWTEEQYIETAINLATDIKMLSEVRKQIRPQMVSSCLCDGKSFVRGLENAFIDIWKRYSAKRQGKDEFFYSSESVGRCTPSSAHE